MDHHREVQKDHHHCLQPIIMHLGLLSSLFTVFSLMIYVAGKITAGALYMPSIDPFRVGESSARG